MTRQYELTDTQREVLRIAVKTGYFEVPRQVTLSELAALEGITGREASEELRKGIESVLQEADLEDALL